jgi:hypothetical protein
MEACTFLHHSAGFIAKEILFIKGWNKVSKLRPIAELGVFGGRNIFVISGNPT